MNKYKVLNTRKMMKVIDYTPTEEYDKLLLKKGHVAAENYAKEGFYEIMNEDVFRRFRFRDYMTWRFNSGDNTFVSEIYKPQYLLNQFPNHIEIKEVVETLPFLFYYLHKVGIKYNMSGETALSLSSRPIYDDETKQDVYYRLFDFSNARYIMDDEGKLEEDVKEDISNILFYIDEIYGIDLSTIIDFIDTYDYGDEFNPTFYEKLDEFIFNYFDKREEVDKFRLPYKAPPSHEELFATIKEKVVKNEKKFNDIIKGMNDKNPLNTISMFVFNNKLYDVEYEGLGNNIILRYNSLK